MDYNRGKERPSWDPTMTLSNLLTVGAGLGLLAPWVACGPPRPVPTVERGRRIDPAVLEGFQRGVTTMEEAQDRLGPPTRTVTARPKTSAISASASTARSGSKTTSRSPGPSRCTRAT